MIKSILTIYDMTKPLGGHKLEQFELRHNQINLSPRVGTSGYKSLDWLWIFGLQLIACVKFKILLFVVISEKSPM